eukprot:TRINITY_DN4646_c0_g1_i1.p1 TRINITY_DN4646_c0_g1~~TRINITY_DN4646_c0_g1_i1.p1  ORF type:complete len:541 (-),score=58.26 TRINITY_DN4646_c0_g1_i1:125-1651(-)
MLVAAGTLTAFVLVFAPEPALAAYTLPLQRVSLRSPALSTEALEEAAVTLRSREGGLPDGQKRLNVGLVRDDFDIDALHDLEPMLLFKEVREQLVDVMDSIFMVDAQLGNPKRNVRLIADTGSSDLWVSTVSGHWRDYRPANSSTALVSSDQVDLKYGRGEVVGTVASDSFCIKDFCIDDMKFVLARKVEDMAATYLYDGLLGLGFPALSHAGKTFLEQFRHDTTFPIAFGLRLDWNGSITLGATVDLIRDAHQQGLGPGVHLPIYGFGHPVKPYYWAVKTFVRLPTSAQSESISPHIGILDSGTSLITLPKKLYKQAVHALIGEANFTLGCTDTLRNAPGMLICACQVAYQMKPLNFSIQAVDGKLLNASLTAKDLTLASVDGQWCRVNFMAMDKMPLIILGDTFLKLFYTIHDYDTRQAILFSTTTTTTTTATTIALQTLGRGEDFGRLAYVAVTLLCVALTVIAVLFAFAGVSNSSRRSAALRLFASFRRGKRDNGIEDPVYLRM